MNGLWSDPALSNDAGSKTGIPACDRYLQIMRCVTRVLQGKAQTAMRQTLRQTLSALKTSLKRLGRSEGTRATMEQACRMSVRV